MNKPFRFALVLPSFVSFVSLLAACAPHVVGGGTGTGAASGGAGGSAGTGGGGCPDLDVPGLCPPSACANGVQQTGGASCIDGVWVCNEATCTTTCDGSLGQQCVSGKLQPFCCPGDAPCAAMLFCDLGNGDCVSDVSCNEIPDAGSGCSAGSIAASSYDQACEADADCAPIYAGSLCGDCFCPNATIASSALAQYDADFAAAGTGPNACFCPDFPPPTCVAGVCTPN